MALAEAFHRNSGEVLPDTPSGETSVGAGGAGMSTVTEMRGLHSPCPVLVQAWTCHWAVPLIRATCGTALHSAAASQPAAAAVYHHEIGVPPLFRIDRRYEIAPATAVHR